jgi:hypothetical protein
MALSQSDARASTVLVDELDARGFQGSPELVSCLI